VTEDEVKAQYDNDCCDNGWRHLCGGTHDLVEREVEYTDPESGEVTMRVMPVLSTPIRPEGCATVRCEIHCSCFHPDGVHDEECALHG
jgi:hypothetical protein